VKCLTRSSTVTLIISPCFITSGSGDDQ